MATSEARILANKANSLKSCGPKTAEGKSISRRNNLKHGLAGAGVVQAAQDAAAIEAREAELRAEHQPSTPMGEILIGQMALYSVRMERAALHESAATGLRVRHAFEAFDEARLDEADRLIEALGENPRRNLRKLRSTPEGVEALLAEWEDLKAALTRPGRPVWAAWHQERAENMTGHRAEVTGGSRITALSNALHGDFSGLDDEDAGDLKAEARQDWARRQLVERIDAEIAGLEAHYETLDFQMLDLDRRGAPARALFDPSKEATLARRYEADATRGFFRALRELKQVEQEAAERLAAAAKAESREGYAPLASSRNDGPPLRDPRPSPTRPEFQEPFEAAEAAEFRRNDLDRPPTGSP